jgi:hypothetical protein
VQHGYMTRSTDMAAASIWTIDTQHRYGHASLT